jgi:Conserved hypothetical protein (DUF2461)
MSSKASGVSHLVSLRQSFSRDFRHSIKANPAPLREIISGPIFESLFGKAKAEKGKRSNIFGHEDELKTAPKGVDKTHPCVLLLFSTWHPR